jgi:hypothetical protein
MMPAKVFFIILTIKYNRLTGGAIIEAAADPLLPIAGHIEA